MLSLSIIFVILALISALFGFGFIASSFVGLAKIFFVLSLIALAITLLRGFIRRRTTVVNMQKDI